jgi:hypothetical protein
MEGSSLSYIIVSQPSHGILSGTTPNLSYTPNSGFSGTDSFTFKASDGKLDSNIAMVSITVNSAGIANNTPLASSQTVGLNEGESKSLTLVATDADADNLNYVVISQPSHGTLSGSAPNLSYTPTNGFSGTDSFTFKVNDGKKDSNIATVSLNVAQLLYKQIAFVSESAPFDNSVLQRGSNLTKTWTFKNSGNLDLTNVRVITINAPIGLQTSVTQDVSSSLAQNAQTSYVLSIDVPSSIAEGTYEATYKLADANGDLKYANGDTAVFYYRFLVAKPNDFKALAYLSASSYQIGENALLGIVINDGNAPYTATVNWGDGTSTTQEIATASNAINLAHAYASAGNYVVNTQVVDAMGQSANVSNTLEVVDGVQSVTSWNVSGADLETNTNTQNIPVTATPQDGYATYKTSWTPQENSLDYWLTYKLSVPNGALKMNKKMRLTLVSTAGELEDHDRVLTYSLSNGKSYAYNIMSNANDGSGFIRIKDFQGSDTKRAVASLTDSAIGVMNTARAYAIESVYGGTSNSATLSAYKYENAAYTLLTSTGTEIDASASLKEIQINFKGNGEIALIKLEYDKDGDGSYSTEESLILNTQNMDVDWSVFVDTNQTTSSSVVKKTGQTKSYDENELEITDGSIKDDGYYQSGAIPLYIRASDIVTDEVTGLMWQDDAATASITKPWLASEKYTQCTNDTNSSACEDTTGDTAATYCSELSLGGYEDWRLPSIKELEGIVDYGKYAPSIDENYFYNNGMSTSSRFYWSSVTHQDYKYDAFGLEFYDGRSNRTQKNTSWHVRCVREIK